MGIFSAHHSTNSDMKSTSGRYNLQENDTKSQTSSTSGETASSTTRSGASSQKATCGCGCGHRAKPVEDEVFEVKEEEWDY